VQTGEQLEHQATLYGKGGNRARAAERYIAAAAKARARYANDAAAELYARGLELFDDEDLLARIDPLHDYGDVLQRTGNTKEALAAFAKMLDAAWRLDYTSKAAASRARIARSATTTKRRSTSIARSRCSGKRATRAASPASRTTSGASLFCAAPIRKRSSATDARSICGARSARSARWRCRCTTWRWCIRRRARTPRR
jgi:tetratricopeptide (TPR) repeat protein